jgi:hypothetical protein
LTWDGPQVKAELGNSIQFNSWTQLNWIARKFWEYELIWIELDNAYELKNFSIFSELNWTQLKKILEIVHIRWKYNKTNERSSYGYDLFCNYFSGLSYPANESYQRLYVSISIILYSHDLIIVFLLSFLWCMCIVLVFRVPMYPCAFLFFNAMGTMLIYLFVYWPNIRHTFVLMDGYDILFKHIYLFMYSSFVLRYLIQV